MKRYQILILVLATFASIFGYKKYEQNKTLDEAADCVASCYTKIENELIKENTLESEMIEMMPTVFDVCCKHCGVEIR